MGCSDTWCCSPESPPPQGEARRASCFSPTSLCSGVAEVEGIGREEPVRPVALSGPVAA